MALNFRVMTLTVMGVSTLFITAAMAQNIPSSPNQSINLPQPVQNMLEAHAVAHLKEMDTNKDGFISKDEFLAEAGNRFDKMDKQHTGKIAITDLATRMHGLGQSLSQSGLGKLISPNGQ